MIYGNYFTQNYFSSSLDTVSPSERANKGFGFEIEKIRESYFKNNYIHVSS